MSNVISSISEPTLQLTELKVVDYSYGTAGDGIPIDSQKDIELRGVEYPHVQINDYVFGPKEIQKFSIDSTDFLPKVSLKVVLLTSGEFLSRSFPKDGDIMNVFIRSRDDLFKPIRNDYLITNVITTAPRSSTQEGKGNVLLIEGELSVPHLYDEKSYAETGTSFSVLKTIASRLELGFATNESNTADAQTWISAKGNYVDFIKHVYGAAWKDEKSFYTAFIDIYYHLNFVNVNELITYDGDVLLALSEDTVSGGQANNETVKKGIEQKAFTNHPGRIRSNFYIKKFKPINNAANIVKKYGYGFNSTFFDHNSSRAWQLQAKSLITSGAAEQKIILRGRADDPAYNTLQKYNYVGVQYNRPDGNVHENFLFARTHNMMNNIELDKLNVETVINKFNFNVFRYENIPAVFMVTNDIKRIKELNASTGISADVMGETSETVNAAIDHFYTGFYLIKGLIINYAPVSNQKDGESGFSETLILARREWPSPFEL